MAQLRHLELGSGFVYGLQGNEVLLPNLQTFSGLRPSDCGQALFRHFPHLKKLGIRYYENTYEKPDCLESVHILHNLVALTFEYMDIIPYGKTVSQKLNLPDAFPLKLKKLTLLKSCLPWKEMAILGRLPNLEILKLKKHAFMGSEWETTEDSFLQLKVLVLESLDLIRWKASSVSFPRLRCLTVRCCNCLEGIPREIGDILTLQEIELDRSNSFVVDSAQEILEEQQNLGNDEFQLHFKL